MTSGPVSLLVADDHPLIRDGLTAGFGSLQPGWSVLTAATAAQTLKALDGAERPVDLVLLDIDMPGWSGLGGLLDILARGGPTRVAILSAALDPALVGRALTLGARGYLPKSLELADVAQAVRFILDGNLYVPPALRGAPLPIEPEALRLASLSPQQHRILRMIVAGALNKQIAGALEISEQTVKDHVSQILRRTGATTRTQAAVIAERLAVRTRDVNPAASEDPQHRPPGA